MHKRVRKGGLTAAERRCINAFIGPAQGDRTKAWRIANPDTKGTAKTAKESACRLFAKPHVKAEIARLQSAVTERVIERAAISKAWVMERLQTVVEQCMADGAMNAGGANRALELIGKELGMFKEKVEHSGPDGTALTIIQKVYTVAGK